MNAEEYIGKLVEESSILFSKKGREYIRQELIGGLIMHFDYVHRFELTPDNLDLIHLDPNVEKDTEVDYKAVLDSVLISHIDCIPSMASVFLSENGKLVKYADNYNKATKLVETAGIDVSAYDNQALKTAAEKGNIKVVDYLLSKGGDIQAINGRSFHIAVSDQSVDVIKKLHERGVNIDDEALHYAAMHTHLDTCQYLAENGANPQTFLDYAKENISTFTKQNKQGMWWAEDWKKTQDAIKHAAKLDSELSKKPLTKAQQLSNDIESEDFSYKPATTRTARTKL